MAVDMVGAGFQAGTAVILLGMAGFLAVLSRHSRANWSLAILVGIRGMAALLYAVGKLGEEGSLARFCFTVMPAFDMALVFAAFWVSCAYPQPRRWLKRSQWLPWALVAVPVALTIAYAIKPTLFWDLDAPGALANPALIAPVGPLFVFDGMFLAAYGFVAWRLARVGSSLAHGLAAKSAILVSEGFLLITLYTSTSLMFGLHDYFAKRPLGVAVALVACIVASLVLCVVATATLWRHHRATGHASLHLIGWPALAVASAVLQSVPWFSDWMQDGSIALVIFLAVWRLALPAMVVYAAARHKFLDIDLQLRWTIKQSTIWGALLLVFFIVTEISKLLLAEEFGLLVGGVATGIMLFAIAPLHHLAERLSHVAVPAAEDPEAYRAFRKYELYHAAFEGMSTDGHLTTKEVQVLEKLRVKLGLSKRLAREIEHDVRQEAQQDPQTAGSPRRASDETA